MEVIFQRHLMDKEKKHIKKRKETYKAKRKKKEKEQEFSNIYLLAMLISKAKAS